jgi:predicted dienelactone hydrolase
MRFFEVLILLALFVSLAGTFVPRAKRPRMLLYLPFLTVVLVALHLVVERFRWQMVPAYLWCLLLIALSILQLRRAPDEGRPACRRIVRILAFAGKLVVALVFLLTAAVPWLFPVVNLPRPTGPYAVGTTALHLVDHGRQETLTDVPGGARELMVRVWYPAEPAPGAKPMPYWPDAKIVGPIRVADDFRVLGITTSPTFLYNHYDLMRTNSYPDAAVASAERAYPVILFSPGALDLVERYFLWSEELASQGYVVVSLSAPYESSAVIFPDGRVVRGTQLRPKPNPSEEDKAREKADQTKGKEIFERFKKSTDLKERKAIMRELFAMDWVRTLDKLLAVRVADARFVLDELGRMTSGAVASPFKARLDLARAAIFGMSFGGAVAGQVCLEDTRFKAGVNLDGEQFGTVIDGSVSQPFMIMYSADNKDMNDFLYDRMLNTTYAVTVAGSSHPDFADFFYTNPFFKRLDKKAISNERMRQVVDAYLVAFFERYLKGKQEPLLDKPSERFPEVTFKIVSAAH